MPIDWNATHQRAIECLRKELCPIHYRTLYERACVGLPDDYSPKTDPAEKLRQRYAERNHPPIVVVSGGMLALNYWFPFNHQPQLIGPYTDLKIPGNAVTAYGAGYEYAQREPHLYDRYSDRQTRKRYLRRRDAFLFESHVRAYYRDRWPQFYLPPSNEGEYDKPARDDFSIRLPGCTKIQIDTKTESFEKNGLGQAMLQTIEPSIIYIIGVWDNDENCAFVKGIISGRWLRSVAGLHDHEFISEGQLMSYEVLSVMLNMAQRGQSYVAAFRDVSQKYAALRTCTSQARGGLGV